MIEVHVVNAFIRPELKDTDWFTILNFINGLVAPSFTFISGFAFIISAKSGLEEMRKFGRRFWKKLGRILLLFLVGYSLHMPQYSFRNIINYATPQSIIEWYNVDILQCIAASLLILFFSRLFIKSNKAYNYFIFASTAIIAIISPFIWHVDFTRFMPMPLANYFNAVHGSFFPLFPWMAFLFAGASASILYLKFREKGKEKYFINKSMIIGMVVFFISLIVLYFLKADPSFEVKPDPFFFLQRAGLVIAALGLCWHYTSRFGEKTSFVTNISRESLLIYFLHLQVIYRKIWNGNSLEYFVNSRFGIPELFFATMILVACMIAVAETWGSFKLRFPHLSVYATRITLAVTVILFFYLT